MKISVVQPTRKFRRSARRQGRDTLPQAERMAVGGCQVSDSIHWGGDDAGSVAMKPDTRGPFGSLDSSRRKPVSLGFGETSLGTDWSGSIQHVKRAKLSQPKHHAATATALVFHCRSALLSVRGEYV